MRANFFRAPVARTNVPSTRAALDLAALAASSHRPIDAPAARAFSATAGADPDVAFRLAVRFFRKRNRAGRRRNRRRENRFEEKLEAITALADAESSHASNPGAVRAVCLDELDQRLLPSAAIVENVFRSRIGVHAKPDELFENNEGLMVDLS